MLSHNLKIAFRNLIRNKTYSLINVVGLALGMAVSVLILSFVMHEFSYDKFHVNSKRTFRIMAKVKMDGNNLQLTGFSAKMGPALKSSQSHVKEFVRVLPSYDKVVIKNPQTNELFYEQNFMFADPSFFKVFSFKLKEGDPKTILEKPSTLIISDRIARKYFGNESPLGKTLLYDGKYLMQIAGVAENPQSNSSLNFDFLTAIATYPRLSETNKNAFENFGLFTTYLLLDSEKSALAVQKSVKKQGGKSDTFDNKAEYILESFASIHLGNNFTSSGNTRLILIFAGIAVLILFLALFNYMSLTTARSTLRAKEVGVRKVVGSGRKGLMQQFYTESALC